MKKVLLTAAAALAVFGGVQAVSAIDKVSELTTDANGNIIAEGPEMTFDAAKAAQKYETYMADDNQVHRYVEPNADGSLPTVTQQEIKDADTARLALDSLKKTEAANAKKAAPAAKDPAAAKAPGAKVLPKTSAVK